MDPETASADASRSTSGLTNADGEVAVRAAKTLFEGIVESYVEPEVARREEAGEWPEGDHVYRFQVQFLDGGAIRTRLNEEVQGILEVKAARDDVKVGDEITAADISEVSGYTPPEEHAHHPHVTGFATGPTWFFAFQLGARDPARHETLRAGREFLAVAHDALAAGRLRACIDNANSAVELLAKTELYCCAPTIDLAQKSRSHGRLSAAYNVWGRRLENSDPRFGEVLNRLGSLRPSARYLEHDLDCDAQQAGKILAVLDDMERHVSRLAKAPQHELPSAYNVFAARQIEAGELVGTDATTLFPKR